MATSAHLTHYCSTPMTVHCTGCHCNFSISSYSSHVQRTGSSTCIAAYQARLKRANDIESAEEEDDNMGVEEDDNMGMFSGDFFGDYDDDDFDWPDEGGLSAVAYVFAIHIYPGPGPLSEHENRCPSADEDFEDSIDIVASVSCSPAKDPYFKIEPFPLATAGAPIPGSGGGASSFATYGHSLGSNKQYAPFQLKLDWDIARWTKLHGPSSSAMS